MSRAGWRKAETEAGYPYYERDDSSSRQWSHPACRDILEKIDRTSNIRYSTYRMAYKVKILQDNLKVPSLRIISGVFAHHCLSISESSFVLEPCELEAILTDIYFAAHKEGSFVGDIDVASEVTLSILLNIYDSDRTSSLSILSAKVALVLLTDDPNREKWRFLFSMLADHNGCISPRRLTLLLTQISLFAEYIGEKSTFGQHLVQSEVDKCFSKTPGMLGLSEHGFFQWIECTSPPCLLIWMDVRGRLQDLSENQNSTENLISWKCSICDMKNPMGLKFKCTRCWGMMICEKCYLYSDMKSNILNNMYRHKKSHIVKEILDPQGMPSQRIAGLVKNMRRILNFPTNCRRQSEFSSEIQFPLESANEMTTATTKNLNDCKAGEKLNPRQTRVFTSTVGKANGNNISDPKTVLQDIIIQLESQNKALKNISGLLNNIENVNSMDRRIQLKVDGHWGQIATQINRLKLFKENILPRFNNQIIKWECENIENKTFISPKDVDSPVFESFSPIPMMPKECINENTIMEHKNIAVDNQRTKRVIDEHDSINMNRNLDSISNVSMSDISTWFTCDKSESDKRNNDTCVSVLKSQNKRDKRNILYSSKSRTTMSEDKFNADIESVATSNNKMKELNADLDSVLDRLQTILTNNFSLDEMNFDNSQLQETANEMEGLLGTLIRGVEQRRTIKGDKI